MKRTKKEAFSYLQERIELLNSQGYLSPSLYCSMNEALDVLRPSELADMPKVNCVNCSTCEYFEGDNSYYSAYCNYCDKIVKRGEVCQSFSKEAGR